MYSNKYIQGKNQWGCPLKYSCRYAGLEFYLKGTQSQIVSCKICEVLLSLSFTEHYLLLTNCFWFPATFLPCFFPLLYQQYINSVTTSCSGTPEIATCMWFILSSLKLFTGNQQKPRSIVTFWVRSTQPAKWYLVVVAQRCSAKNLPWNIWQNSQENVCTGDF